MSTEKQWPMPSWHDSLPDEEKAAARAKVLLTLAALYATQSGTATAFAELLELSPTTVLQAKARGKVSGELAVKIESILGRSLFPRELFRPDLFVIEG